MINQDLLTYIKRELDRKTTKEVIQSNLLSNGWDLKDIEEGFSVQTVTPIENYQGIVSSPKKYGSIVFDIAIVLIICVLGGSAFAYYKYLVSNILSNQNEIVENSITKQNFNESNIEVSSTPQIVSTSSIEENTLVATSTTPIITTTSIITTKTSTTSSNSNSKILQTSINTPPTCSLFSYSNWSDCQSNNIQTRTIISNSPNGCIGGNPTTSHACSYVIPILTCSSFGYSDWSNCQSDNNQNRIITSSSPNGCTGGSPITSQACSYVIPILTCSSFGYSDWSACQSDNNQNRIITSSSPNGCTGGSPITSQSCNYTPPIVTCGGKICSQYQACTNNKCILQNTPYKLGLVYIYSSQDNYNPDWKTEISSITDKVVNALKEVSDNKIDASINIIGETQVDTFNWNPAEVGFKVSVGNGGYVYLGLPNSSFLLSDYSFSGTVIENYCKNCILNPDPYNNSSTKVTTNYNNNLSYDNLWNTNMLSELDNEIEQKLNFKFSDYDGVYVVFGKLGSVLPQESELNRYYACNSLSGIIGGYANLIMAENSIELEGLVQCENYPDISWNSRSYYFKTGWHNMAHEILHRFGTVDVYDTGTVFGYDVSGNKKTAMELDSRTNESIMGNDVKDCETDDGYIKNGIVCTQEELESVYLDKYNRQLIGLDY